MAILDIQVTNASLREIRGSLSATQEEGSWMTTAYLAAEVIAIPLTAFFVRVFGVRVYMVGNSALFLPVLALRKGKTWWRTFRGHSIEDHPVSDLAFYPKPVNEALYRILSAETKLMQHWDLPVGVSILAVAQRPLEANTEAAPVNLSINSLIADSEQQKVLTAQ